MLWPAPVSNKEIKKHAAAHGGTIGESPGQVTESHLRLHLPAPLGFVWCVHCLGFHDGQFHDRAWRKYYQGDRDAFAVYTRPPRRR